MICPFGCGEMLCERVEGQWQSRVVPPESDNDVISNAIDKQDMDDAIREIEDAEPADVEIAINEVMAPFYKYSCQNPACLYSESHAKPIVS